MDKGAKTRRHLGRWRVVAILLGLLAIGLTTAVVILAIRQSQQTDVPPRCGSKANNKNFVDLSEPNLPGPFHDLTKHEMVKVREFLQKDPDIHIAPAENATMRHSALYVLDLFPAKKSDVLAYLDNNGPQPDRQARAMVFRGDLNPPMVEEYICYPLPDVEKCTLLKSDKRRNPVEFSLRPVSLTEFTAVYDIVLKLVDQKLGYILKNSYGTAYHDCPPQDCFKIYPSPLATNLVNDITMRRLWIWAEYNVEYYGLNPVDFGVLAILDGADPSKFTVDKVWYHGQIFDSMDHLIDAYNNNRTEKTHIEKPTNTKDAFSSLNQHGDLLPEEKLRPPTLVEPDGKRYTIKDRKVNYLGWSFHYRMSALTGPSLWDIRYKGERIAYELSLSEIAVFYSADNEIQRVTDFVDSGALIGSHSKSMVPGADCPESATFINQSFAGQSVSEPTELPRALCIFENNNGYPLRRHLSYSTGEGGFYGGMLDSVLTFRAITTIINYDYVFDFIFHQNGVIETRVMSTGYVSGSFFNKKESPYGFQTEEHFIAPIHHHMFHFKADLDISGTTNTYETLDIVPETVQLRAVPGRKYHQTKFVRNVKTTEKDALFKFNFDYPKYHVVHNENKKTKFNEIRGYRISLHGMSKQILPEDVDNERSIPWARHQLVVTKYKDDEQVSSSPYAMWDSLNPVTNFTTFYEDNENIANEDLVFWITSGMHHIPRTEDLPLTTTIGNHLTFYLLPMNYFDLCPSVTSRDHIRIEYKDPHNPKDGVKVDRNGNSYDTCSIPATAKEYDQLLQDNPDIVIESKQSMGIL